MEIKKQAEPMVRLMFLGIIVLKLHYKQQK